MAVRVRLFAAVREAAGTGETEVPAGPLDALLAELEQRYGPRFAERLRSSTVLLDGSTVRRGEGTPVADGSELAILPPVSGGGRRVP